MGVEPTVAETRLGRCKIVLERDECVCWNSNAKKSRDVLGRCYLISSPDPVVLLGESHWKILGMFIRCVDGLESRPRMEGRQ